ncbi:hypothetical protein DVH05_013697 [Phytophthora capsici]|nr:hypothetical protein DVH05_013697 [Phytophthora capsici]
MMPKCFDSKDKYKDSLLEGIAVSDLTVFENRAKYDVEENETLIVVVPDDEGEGRLSLIYARAIGGTGNLSL